MPVDSDVVIDSSPPEASPSPPCTEGAGGAGQENEVTDAAQTASAVTKPGLIASSWKRILGYGVWKRILGYGVLPGLALILAIGAGYLKWQGSTLGESPTAAAQSVAVARDATIALLSYRPATVEKDLTAARDRTTGSFRDAYWQLVSDVVIPGAKQQQISVVATVPAAAPVSATASQAVVLVFVDQAITIGNDPPTNTASSVRVTLEKVHDRWLISQFDPV